MHEAEQASRARSFPFITLILGGASIAVYYLWNKWNYHRAHRSFVFSEMNVLNLGNYQSIFLNPLSLEQNFFFYLNFPGLVYASYLLERSLGPRFLIGAYLLNCGVSALTTAIYHRQIGFKKVQQRGRVANSNGNITLFLTTLFATMAPSYRIYGGKSMATTIFFYYLTLFYCLLFFTRHIAASEYKYSRNDNETHYAAVVLGLALGFVMRARLRR